MMMLVLTLLGVGGAVMTEDDRLMDRWVSVSSHGSDASVCGGCMCLL